MLYQNWLKHSPFSPVSEVHSCLQEKDRKIFPGGRHLILDVQWVRKRLTFWFALLMNGIDPTSRNIKEDQAYRPHRRILSVACRISDPVPCVRVVNVTPGTAQPYDKSQKWNTSILLNSLGLNNGTFYCMTDRQWDSHYGMSLLMYWLGSVNITQTTMKHTALIIHCFATVFSCLCLEEMILVTSWAALS